MSDRQKKDELLKAQEYAEKQKFKLELKKIKHRYDEKKKPLSTSKLIAAYLFVILNVVLIFAMAAMWHFQDLSSLGILITDIAAQILTYFIYARKSLAENSANGIVYELAMREKDKFDTQTQSTEEHSVG